MTHVLLAAIPTPTVSPTPATVFGQNVIGFSFLLSTIVWAPVVWAIVLALVPNPRGRNDRFFYGSSFWVMAGVLALELVGYMQFSAFQSGPQFDENLPWMPVFGIRYHLAADGISMVALLLNGIVGVAGVLASTALRARPRGYFVLLLLGEAAVNGLVCARDLFAAALFFGAAGVPVALLVSGWGRTAGAGTRLLVYWGVGSAALLLGVLLVGTALGGQAWDLDTVRGASPTPRLQIVAAVLFVAAAATRLPLFPLHAGVRDALSEAPVGVVIVVAGAATRSGGYLLLRLLDASLHDATRLLAPFVAVLAGITVVYAALAALRTRDLRRLGAYLAMVPGAVTALGAAGITPLSMDGACLSLFTGGLAAALMAGACAITADLALTRDLRRLGGLAGRTPRLAWLLILAGVGVIGLPLTGGFLALLMVFFGSFRDSALGSLTLAGGLVGVAAAVGWMLHRVLFGAPNPDAPPPADAPLTETWALAILAGALIWVGVLPGGPKLAGVPVFDPGVVNVVNGAAGDLSAPYAPPSPPPGAGGGT